jgi:cytoskeletal protein RodZ
MPELPAGPKTRGPLPAEDLEAPGAYLRRCREHQGWSIADLAHRTRILCLEGIEREAYDAVPPEPYIRGFVTNYGRALGVPNPDAVAAAFVRRLRLGSAAVTAKRKPTSRGFFRKAS